MKRIHILGIALLALFALCAFSASAAFAEELLPVWLVAGEPIAAGTEVNVDIEGELLLEDMNATGKPDILCVIEEGLGFLLADGAGTVTKGLCGKPVIDSGTCGSPKVVAVHLPWTTALLTPTGNEYENDINAGTGGEPGWEAECTVLGVKVKDVCSTDDGFVLVINLAEGLVEIDFMEEIEKAAIANCTVGGKEQGLVVGPLILHALNAAAELVSLEVSLELD